MTEQLERLVEADELHTMGVLAWPPAAVPIQPPAVVPTQPPAEGRRTRVSRVVAAWRTVAASLTYKFPEPRPHPKRLWYLDDARLLREMTRR